MRAYLYAITRRLNRLIFTADPTRFFVILLFGLILGLVALTVFVVSRGFFIFLSQYPVVFKPLSLYIFQTTLLGIYIFAVGSYTFLFYQRFKATDNIIFKLENSSSRLIIFKSMLETAILGSWTIVSLIVPALFGFNSVANSPQVYVIKQFIGLFLYIFLALIPAAVLVFALGSFSSVKARKLLLLGVSLLLILASFFLTRVFLPERLVHIAAQPDVEEVVASLARLPVSNILLPSAHLAGILVNGSGLLFLFGLAVAFVLSFFLLVNKFSHSIWQRLQEGVFIANPYQRVDKKQAFMLGSQTSFPTTFSFLFKDVLQLLRLPSRIGYLMFILFITLVYLTILAQAPAYSKSLPFYETTVRLGLLLIPGYLLLTLLMQFVFPSLRLEIESLFLFSGILCRWSRLIKEKLSFAVLLALLFSVFTVLSTAIFFDRSIIPIRYASFILMVSFLLTSIVFTVGSSFTKFLKSEFDDKTTNIPGLAATVAGIVLIVLASLLYINYGVAIIFLLILLGLLSPIVSFVIVKWALSTADLL